MRAAVIDRFGGAEELQLRDMPKPVPGEGQILVRVCASNVNPIDWKMREGQMAARYGDEFPMILGWDCAGVVEQLGPDVSDFAVGDAIMARSDVGTGRCYADFAVLNTRTVVPKPAHCSHAEAGAVPLVGLTAINGLRDCAHLLSGQRVLVIGASGGVGTVAVQIARNMGAGHVTGVCSGANTELVASLGVDEVIDYTDADPFETDQPYDIIYDTIGAHTHEAARKALTAEGTYLTLVPVPGIDFFVPGQTDWEPGKGYFVAWTPKAADLQLLADWMEAGKLRVVIDSTFPLEDVRKAHERSATERAVGKIVIDVAGS